MMAQWRPGAPAPDHAGAGADVPRQRLRHRPQPPERRPPGRARDASTPLGPSTPSSSTGSPTFTATPTMLQRIADLPGIDDRDLSSIDWILQGAAPMPPSLVHRWADLIGPERILMAYGMTEAIGITALRGDEWLAHEGSVGRGRGAPRPGYSTTPATTCRRARSARSTCARPPTAATDYLGDAPHLRTTEDGFQTVGDMGYLDEDGYLYVVDRRVDMIITGGANVFPAQVEERADRPPADRRRRRGGPQGRRVGSTGARHRRARRRGRPADRRRRDRVRQSPAGRRTRCPRPSSSSPRCRGARPRRSTGAGWSRNVVAEASAILGVTSPKPLDFSHDPGGVVAGGGARRAGRRVPDREMLICGEVRRTYGEVASGAGDWPRSWQERGLGLRRERDGLERWESGQDAVALVLQQRPRVPRGDARRLRARAVPFNVNQHYRTAEVEALLSDVGPRAVVYHRRYGPLLAEAVDPADLVLIDVDDGSGVAAAAGQHGVRGRGRHAGRRAPGAVARRPLHGVHRRHHRAAEGRALATGRHLRVGDGGDRGRDRRVDRHRGGQRQGGPGSPSRRSCTPPPSGRRSAGCTGSPRSCCTTTATASTPARSSDLVERERVFLMSIVGDAYARPLVEELRGATYDLCSLFVLGTGGAATSDHLKEAPARAASPT